MSEAARHDVGLVGLGVMGGNLARNFARHGWRVAGWSRHVETARALAAAHPEAKLHVAPDLAALVAALARPRRILLLVPAGGAVDAVLEDLAPHLDEGDVVMDGGNSHFLDTERRMDAAGPWMLVGMGISGGAEGALHGPSLMPGGPEAAWRVLRPLLEPVAAASDAGPCVAWCGRRSAGHFVKMVHNGIEYADMQHLAEATLLLRRGLGLEAAQVADLFARWNQGALESFLLEISADVLRVPDPAHPERLLLDAVLDRAGQKGTGRWTVQTALELGVAVPSIGAAVDARILSGELALRERAAATLGGADEAHLSGAEPEDVHRALLGARLAAHAQGFALLAAADAAHGYGTRLAEVARIWRAGCILRARVLDPIRRALAARPDAPLVLAPELREHFDACRPGWRRTVAAAAGSGLPAPGLAASLAWLDGLTTARGSASLLQALRDRFGAHGYERRDAPGERVHSAWEAPATSRPA